MGRVVDVVVDSAGQARAAVIDFGGFLGVGNRKIVVDWNALHFAPTAKDNRITLELSRDQLKAAPEFKEGQPLKVLDAPRVISIVTFLPDGGRKRPIWFASIEMPQFSKNWMS